MNDTYQQLKTKENSSKRITNSTCIATGGAGFIGSHLTHALAKLELN